MNSDCHRPHLFPPSLPIDERWVFVVFFCNFVAVFQKSCFYLCLSQRAMRSFHSQDDLNPIESVRASHSNLLNSTGYLYATISLASCDVQMKVFITSTPSSVATHHVGLEQVLKTGDCFVRKIDLFSLTNLNCLAHWLLQHGLAPSLVF